MSKIFICTSFSSKVDKTGKILPEHRNIIEPVIETIRAGGHVVFCAAEHEGWRITDGDPTVEFKGDLNRIRRSDIMLVLLEETISAGVQLEIGYMLSEIERNNTKKLILAHPKDTKLAWSNQAISALPGVTSVAYSSVQDIAAQL